MLDGALRSLMGDHPRSACRLLLGACRRLLLGGSIDQTPRYATLMPAPPWRMTAEQGRLVHGAPDIVRAALNTGR